MKLAALVHAYPPEHNAGAEWMLHSILRWLVRRGHAATVAVGSTFHAAELDGVRIVDEAEFPTIASEADVLLTHLDRTQRATRVAGELGRPLVHLVHNDAQLAFHRVERADLVVINSRWLAHALRWPGPTIIVHPPVFADDYRAAAAPPPAAREYVTLLNLTGPKGGPLLFRLAELEPGRRFLAVRGAYGVQEVPRRPPRNVDVIPNTPNVVADVYARTRVLLVPSSYESWGRVAIEAAANGIPVIAHPTPGLVESLDTAGLFAQRHRPDEWRRALTWLDDPANYRRASLDAAERALELDPTDELGELERALQLLADGHRADVEKLYAPTMILGARCPICGTPGHSCGATTDVAGNPIVDTGVKPAGPKRIYRTATGDFLYSLAGARHRGLAPDGDQLHPRIVRRLLDLGATPSNLDALRAAWRTMDGDARQAWLDRFWLLRGRPALDFVAELPTDAVAARAAATPPPPTESEDVPDGRAGTVLAWVGADLERARRALDLELARPTPRKTLTAALEELLA